MTLPLLSGVERDCLERYLGSGRQISPAIVQEGRLSHALAAAVAADGVRVWPRA